MNQSTGDNTQADSGRKTGVRRFYVGLMLGLLLAGSIFSMLTGQVGAAPAIRPASVWANHIVIGEFRTRGPLGANDEFIEIYNPTALSVPLANWTIKKAVGCGAASATPLITFGVSDTLSAGQHFLIVNSSASPALLAMADASYASSIADDGGIAVMDDLSNLVDSVGMCATTVYVEGTALGSLTTNADRGYERNTGGSFGSCDDSDNNSVDFHLQAPSDPQNLASAPVVCADSATPTATLTTTETSTDSATPTETSTPTISTTPTITPTTTLTLTPGYLRIIINEVAWAGTGASDSDEWIEFYNPNSVPINTTGWVLKIVNPNVTIPLNPITIASGGYYLLENDETTTSVPSDQTAASISLSNSGSLLQLYDPLDRRVDTANFNQGAWPAGTSSPIKCSMERASNTAQDIDSGWFTNNNVVHIALDANGNPICGTPKNLNWSYSVTATPSRTPTRTPTRTRTPIPGTVRLILTSIAAQDGWILESSENSNVGGSINNISSLIVLGDHASNKQYRSLLSFNTSGIPDNAIISGVKLRLKKQNINGGGNPISIFQGFMVDLKTGFFGTTAALQAADFQSAVSQTLGPASPVLSNNTYTITLTAGASKINKLSTNSGLTQIRLRFKVDDNNNSFANYLSLFSSNTTTAVNRPQLVITYTLP